MQRMNAHRQHIVIAINQPNSFLQVPIYLNLRQPREARDAVVLVRDIIARLQRF